MDRAEVMHRLRGLKATAETTRDREALDLAVEALLEKHQLSGETSTNWGVSEDGKTSWRTEPTRDDQMETQGERMTRIVYELSGETSTISEKESVEDDLINKSLWRMGLDDTNVILCKMANTSTNEDDAESATTTNCISRQDAIEAICSECAYGVAGQCNHSRGDSCDFSDALESLPPVTPTVSEDCISRAEAIEEVEALPDTDNGYSDTYDKACIIGVLEELPSVTPTERTGITTDIAFSLYEEIRCEVLCTNPMKSDRGCNGRCQYDTELLKRIDEVIERVIVDSPTERTGEWVVSGMEDDGRYMGSRWYACDQCGNAAELEI